MNWPSKKLMQQVGEISRGRCGLKITFDGTAIYPSRGRRRGMVPEHKAMLRHFYDQWRHAHDD